MTASPGTSSGIAEVQPAVLLHSRIKLLHKARDETQDHEHVKHMLYFSVISPRLVFKSLFKTVQL